MIVNQLRQKLIDHEGLKLFPYQCPRDKMTLGVGRNIEDMGINYEEAMVLLDNDISRCVGELSHFDWFLRLTEVRRGVLIELNFNIGLSRLLLFKKMIAALEVDNYVGAATEMLDSLWSRQVGAARSNDMANRMISGRY